MKLLFVADGRSPTAVSWLRYWIETGHETHLVSTYPSIPLKGLASYQVMPVAFSALKRSQAGTAGQAQKPAVPRRARELFRHTRYYAGPLTLPFYRCRLVNLVRQLGPDLVHGLRIPFEGMLAAAVPLPIPVVISSWGNDFTLHAHGSILMKACTRQAMDRADGFISDTIRDLRLGREWGFSTEKPTLVIPGAGGIRLQENNGSLFSAESFPEELPEAPIVVNPRGQRPGSLRQDIFFQAIPYVLEKLPNVVFVCPSLAGDPQAEAWVEQLGIRAHTRLWPRLHQQAQLWRLLRLAEVFVSPSLHDGTPNSLLEAMACGCFPVVGNIESSREWIEPGRNGLLVDANSIQSVADGILCALRDSSLREKAKIINAGIIAERADYSRCMAMVQAFYEELVAKKAM